MNTSNYCRSMVSAFAFIGAATMSFAGELQQNADVHRFEDLSIVEGADAYLVRMDHGVYMHVVTDDLEPGHAVTMWWVVFNNPAECSGDECGEDDVFNLNADGSFILNDDGSPPLNSEQWDKIQLSLLRADGIVVPADGIGEFRGHLPIGDTSEAVLGPGLLDSMKAEVHMVLRDHMTPTPETQNIMLNTLNGGCEGPFPNEPCVDPQFAVFKPAI